MEITIDVSDHIVDQIDDCYEERGFDSRQDFIRKAILDAINADNPYTEDAWEEIKNARESTGWNSLEEVLEESDLELDN